MLRNRFTIEEKYTDKSFAVRDKIANEFQPFRPLFNFNLKNKTQGWIFSKNNAVEVEKVAKKHQLVMEPYSDKAVVVYDSEAATCMANGKFTTLDSGSTVGWIFSNKQLEAVKKALMTPEETVDVDEDVELDEVDEVESVQSFLKPCVGLNTQPVSAKALAVLDTFKQLSKQEQDWFLNQVATSSFQNLKVYGKPVNYA